MILLPVHKLQYIYANMQPFLCGHMLPQVSLHGREWWYRKKINYPTKLVSIQGFIQMGGVHWDSPPEI